jgi:hypothetical protein
MTHMNSKRTSRMGDVDDINYDEMPARGGGIHNGRDMQRSDLSASVMTDVITTTESRAAIIYVNDAGSRSGIELGFWRILRLLRRRSVSTNLKDGSAGRRKVWSCGRSGEIR